MWKLVVNGRPVADPVLKTALSDLEVLSKEEEGKPNADAQKKVGELTQEAAKIAKEDAPDVQASLNALIAKGEYPAKLWN